MSKSDAEGLRIVCRGLGIALCGCAVANLLGYAVPDLLPTVVLGLLGLASLIFARVLAILDEIDSELDSDYPSNNRQS
jgi:hypothetical protein